MPATKARLDRGQRIVELFKQVQYNPIPVEEQVAVLWAMQNGYLDSVPVEKVKQFQVKLQEYLSHAEGKPARYHRFEEARSTKISKPSCGRLG